MRTGWAIVGLALLLGGSGAALANLAALPGMTDPVVLRLGGSLALLGCVAAGYVCIEYWDPHPAPAPDVETGVRVPVPGDGIDDLLFDTDRSDLQRSARHYRRTRVRELLRTVVVNTLVTDANEPPERAEQLVADGAWTDDERVAAFVSPDREEPEGGSGLLSLRGRHPPVDELTRRTIEELERLREEQG